MSSPQEKKQKTEENSGGPQHKQEMETDAVSVPTLDQVVADDDFLRL
jgi:hypothetical protein